jgi:hypothetical protein
MRFVVWLRLRFPDQGRLVKTLPDFDLSFQPSVDRDNSMTAAWLDLATLDIHPSDAGGYIRASHLTAPAHADPVPEEVDSARVLGS